MTLIVSKKHSASIPSTLMAKENPTTRSPIKIACYTTSTEKTKCTTIITAPNNEEYNFQYSEADINPNTTGQPLK